MENSQTKVIYELEEFPNNNLIHHKIYKTPQAEYTIITYDKNMVCMDDAETGKYRSVIFSQGSLVSFSPPKSINTKTFARKNLSESSANKIPETVHITETIEGTMISLFYDHPNETWEIATKNAVGGRYWYFQNKNPHTFRDMFMEAIGERDYANLNYTKLVENLPKDCCYSFVLQHPKNHIVFDIDAPRVFLVAVYQIQENTARYLSLPYVANLTAIHELLTKNIIYMTITIQYSMYLHQNAKKPVHTFDQILCDMGLAKSPTDYVELEQHLNYSASYAHMMGLTLINTETGERTKLENQQYNYKKALRGNHPNMQYQYLCLCRIQKIPEFLKCFPIYTATFDKFKTQFDQFVSTIQTTYYMYYVKKQRNVEFSKHIMYFVQKIHHELFLPSLKTSERVIISRRVVHDWLLETFQPGAILYHMNIPNTNMDSCS